MQKEDIINILRQEMPTLKSRFGVQSIGLFGSYARDKNDQNSDLDFLVEIKEPLADNYFGLWDFLEDRFNMKIDLVRKGNHLSGDFLTKIQAHIIYA
jgi:predicted nucleotidyltransferase